MPAIELIAVSKALAGRPVLDAISVSVDRGRSLAVTGPSGVGKTTLLRLVAGLERPDAGTVRIDGYAVSGNGIFVPPAGRNIGMVFQDFALWPHFRAERHLDFVLRARGMSRSARRDCIAALLELCHLEDKRRSYPNQLSGGQQQRLAIARAFASERGILLLDEPFSQLDEALRLRLSEEITRRMRESGVTVIVAAHDPDDLVFPVDAVLRLTQR